MPLPLAAAAMAAGRLALRQRALAAARKAVKKAKSDVKKAPQRMAEDALLEKKRPTWLEIVLFAGPLAALNDALDIFNITIVGKLVTILVDFLTAAILFIWFWFRVGQTPQRKLTRMVLTLVTEIIFGVGMLPMWLIMVLNAKTGWFNWIYAIPDKLLSL